MKNFRLLALSLLISGQAFAQTKPAASKAPLSKYFIVQNIATEKMRIYERCTTTPDCAHRMVYQTDMVVGKIDGDKSMWTKVGTYKIEKWVKFYEDGPKHYPSWYDPNYPATPSPGKKFGAWTDNDAMPNGRGDMRGAFGWYAATMTPNASGQWMHGTIGWGSDGDKFIKQTRGFLANVFADPRSHGCTRVENRAVAFVQSFIPAGTEVFRVYALENVADQTLARYENQRSPMNFEFMLTGDQVRKDNPNSIAMSAVQRRIQEGQLRPEHILEHGHYQANQYPSVQGLRNKRASSGESGDTYSLGGSVFRGVFIVDEGRFAGYEHPVQMPRGGVSGAHTVLPEYVKSGKTNLIPAVKVDRNRSDEIEE